MIELYENKSYNYVPVFVDYTSLTFWIHNLNEFRRNLRTEKTLLHLCLWCTHCTYKCTKNSFPTRVDCLHWLSIIEAFMIEKQTLFTIKICILFTLEPFKGAEPNEHKGNEWFWSLARKFHNTFFQGSYRAYENIWSPSAVFRSQWKGPWHCFLLWSENRSKIWVLVWPALVHHSL